MFKILVATDRSEYPYELAGYAGHLARRIEATEVAVLSLTDAKGIAQAPGAPSRIPSALSAETGRAA